MYRVVPQRWRSRVRSHWTSLTRYLRFLDGIMAATASARMPPPAAPRTLLKSYVVHTQHGRRSDIANQNVMSVDGFTEH